MISVIKTRVETEFSLSFDVSCFVVVRLLQPSVGGQNFGRPRDNENSCERDAARSGRVSVFSVVFVFQKLKNGNWGDVVKTTGQGTISFQFTNGISVDVTLDGSVRVANRKVSRRIEN